MSLETMTKLGTYTVGAGTDSAVSFSNIPQSYTDLILKVSGHLTGTGFGETILKLTFNSSTSGYSWRSVLTDASATYSQKGDSVAYIEAGIIPASQLSVTTNVFGVVDMLISNYTSNNSKAVSIDYAEERSSADNYIGFVSGVWANTAPITSLTVTPSSSNFSQYSTFTLYGVKAMRTAIGNSIKAFGGDTVAFDGTYWRHTFTSTGTFIPTANLIADYLVVAGGGGSGATMTGADYNTGAGGAGGYRYRESYLLTKDTNYIVTIGAGGTAGGAVGGSNSSIIGGPMSFSATGGGVGGAGSSGTAPSNQPTTGGSGGGGGSNATSLLGAAGNAGGYSPVEGYEGATAPGGYYGTGGGGGGSGGAASVNVGGVGTSNSISGSAVTYATGGNAQTGGGAGKTYSTTDATANTGNGGNGGRSQRYAGAAGGSGIVIIRYKA